MRHKQCCMMVRGLLSLVLFSLALKSCRAAAGETQQPHLHSDVWAWLNRAVTQLGSNSNKQCEDGYGVSFIEQWRSSAKQLCSNSSEIQQPNDATKATNASSVTAYPKAFSIKKWLAGESRNLVLNTDKYLQAVASEEDVSAQRGALQASCKLQLDGLDGYLDHAFSKMWPAGVFQGEQAEAVKSACSPGSPNVVEHPVLLLLRRDTTNVYHFLEEVMMVFLTLAVTRDERVQRQGIQVLIADKAGPGNYMSVWRRLSRPHKVRFLSDDPLPPGTCLRYVLHNPWAHGISILSLFGVGVPTDCRSSPILVAASNWLRSMFQGLLVPRVQPGGHTPDGQPVHVTVKTIVWISRANLEAVRIVTGQTSGWGTTRMYSNEAEFIMDLTLAVLEWNDEACFRHGVKPGMGTAPLKRRRISHRLRGEQQVPAPAQGVQALTDPGPVVVPTIPTQSDLSNTFAQQRRQLLESEHCRPSTVVYELKVVDLDSMPFNPDQLVLFGGTSILMASHGAGLGNIMWMKPGTGGMVEVQHNAQGNEHYQIMASLLNHRYVAISSNGEELNSKDTIKALITMMDQLA